MFARTVCCLTRSQVKQVTAINALTRSSFSSHIYDSTGSCNCLACGGFQFKTPKRPLLISNPRRAMSFTGPDGDDSMHIEPLLQNNKKWVEDRTRDDPEFFSRLGKGQSPRYLYFGCSDSRVPANEILGLGPGDVFVHRNVGNLVPGNDLNSLSVLEFAVGHLHVTDIIVVGHYDCKIFGCDCLID